MKLKFTKNKYFETFVVFMIVFLLNYFFDREHLLYPDSFVNPYMYVFVAVSLFYSLLASIFYFILYFGAEYLIYHKVNLPILFEMFLLMVIMGEFTTYWNNKLSKYKEQNDYLKNRLEEVGNAYYLLKISHDELEKNYILKPFSIREVLREVKELAYKSIEESFSLLTTLIKNLFKLEKGGLFTYEDGVFYPKAMIGDFDKLDTNDPLVVDAVNYHQIAFVGNLREKKSKYLAVIPIVSLNDEVKGIFVIEQIPFFNLSKDTLLIISLFLSYFVNLIEGIEEFKGIMKIDPFIAREIKTLRHIFRKYKVESYLVIFHIKSDIQKAHIQKYIRGSDIVFEYKDKFCVILPFTSSLGVSKFVERMTKEMELTYTIVDLSKTDLEEIQELLDKV
jgi:hypothetical protein